MDLRSGIFSTASHLGIDPYDLATIISYETAGTFDPTKAGPTTQWGQHRGLIQFGEPQAKEYGVDWSNPVGSQLGPDGAVARYLTATGVKPGMGMLDIYSAINAGGVGRYNRTDENNGGAPGTVREKVETQMAGHRTRAEALLGGSATQPLADEVMVALGKQPLRQPTPQPAATTSTRGVLDMEQPKMQDYEEEMAGGIFGKLFPNMTRDRQDRIALALGGLSMHPNQAMMGMAQQGIMDRSDKRAEFKKTQAAQAQQNKTVEYIATKLGRPDLAQAVMQGVLTPSAAYAEAKKAPEQTQWDWNSDLGVYVDKADPTNTYAPQGAGGGIDAEGETGFRKEYMGLPETKDFAAQAKAFDQIRAAANQPDAAGDLAIIFGYMKMLDPGSTVREGEAASVQNAAGVPERVINMYNNALTGQRLSADQRAEFVNRAGRLYESAEVQAQGRRGQYQGIASDYGFDQERSVPDVSYQSPYAPQTSALRPRSKPQGAPTQGAPTQQPLNAQQISSAIQQLSPLDQQLLTSLPTPEAQIRFLKEKGVLQ